MGTPNQTSPEGATDHRQVVEPVRRNPCIMGTPNQASPERATECGQIAQPRTAGKQRSAGKWREMDRNGECMRRVERDGRLMVSVTPPGFPVSGGSVYRGSAIAPPPACGLATPTGFPIRDGSVYRGSAVAPPPACDLLTPTGFPIRDGSVLQGFRYRFTACL